VTSAEKATFVDSLHERFQVATFAVATEYRGLTVAEMNELRRDLKGVNARYRVSKNTLTRLALKDTTFAKLDEFLSGPIGIVTSGDDPVAAAKILVKFAEKHDKLKISGGVLDGEAMPAAQLGELAKLPSREVLLGQFLGLLQAPASTLLRTIQEPSAQFVRLLGALERSKKEQEPAA